MTAAFNVEDFLRRFAHDTKIAIALMKGERLEYTVVNDSYAAIREPGVAFVGRTYREVFPEAAERGAETKLRQVIRTAKPWYIDEFETPIPGREGMTWWEGECLPIAVDGVHVDSVLVLNWEVTERKRTQQAIVEAERRKDDFLATLAHELRNPLAPICYGLELMRLAGDDSVAREKARAMMERQTRQLVRLVDDLLDIARISTNKLELRKQRVDLDEVIRTAVETSRPVMQASSQALSVSLPRKRVVLDADPIRLAQAVSNLLNNAAKYSRPGDRIELAAEREGDAVCIRVRDHGVGIPRDELQRIFDMFVQLDASATPSYGGLGIGLSLVQRLVQMHGGSVHAHSEGRDKGSEFTIRLPLVSLSGRPVVAVADRAAAPVPARRIVVADDNHDAADGLAMLLSRLGHQVETTYAGREAVALVKNLHPDVAFLDLGMPEVNGYEAARRIRVESPDKHVVLVAITGWGQEHDRRRSEEAGFDFHLVKPVEAGALEELLRAAGSR